MVELPTHSVDLADEADALSPAGPWIESEWLLTNGLGGFAMGTPSGVNTRRYHSLLIASPQPPLNRLSTLAAVNALIEVGGNRYEIDTHEFAAPGAPGGPGSSVFHPRGWRMLESFSRTAAECRWEYRCGPLRVARSLRLIWRRQLAVMSWRITPAAGKKAAASGPVSIRLQPLVAGRDFHHHRRCRDNAYTLEHDGRRVTIQIQGLPALHLQTDAGTFTARHEWWTNFKHRAEAARGSDDIEDLFSPGVFTCSIDSLNKEGATLQLALGIEPIDWRIIHGEDGRAAHLASILQHVRSQAGSKTSGGASGDTSGGASGWALDALALASDDFVVPRPVKGRESTTILAGYPWFSDWGRDTMISLPGLLLATGRFTEARQTLFTFGEHLRGGLVPNRFDDYGGDPHYNTVDAPLWFVHAALEYLRLSGDKEAWNDLLARACAEILRSFAAGTDYDIRKDADGLISAGSPETQLTWMDAKNSGIAFTPRWGKAVEINALWHRGLAGCAAVMARKDKKAAAEFKQLAAEAKKSFARVFWDARRECLIDHVTPRGADPALRPNQVFAVSLPISPLTTAQQKKVMSAVQKSLLTPMGLRTLPPGDPNYHPWYTGSMFERDRAYHQGTVWPWLIGPYVEGHLRAHNFSTAAKTHARAALAPLLDHLMTNGLGQLPEIAEANAPHRPDGCPAQAWSIAEVLRVLLLIKQGK